MHTQPAPTGKRSQRSAFIVWIILLGACFGSRPTTAQTYISAEPIPSEQIVGTANLTKILDLGYPKLQIWSERLVRDCQIVQEVIHVLAEKGVITTIGPSNTHYAVAAGGFEGVTDPSYVLTIDDSASASDVFVLDNALGYVLNQSGTAQFSLHYDPDNPYEFSLAYAVVRFQNHLTGEGAAHFFNYLGTIDPALWTGSNAGFTQIDLPGSHNYNAMLFLIGDVSTDQFTAGIYRAATSTRGASYLPLGENGQPTTGTAGVAFPGNDWSSSPDGQDYLVNIVNAPAGVLAQLAMLRQKHLRAVAGLLEAIDNGDVERYLRGRFECPCTEQSHGRDRTEPEIKNPGTDSQSHPRRHSISPHR
jgi:hypothetical protein